ncbi:MAG: hypothetical protein JWO93_940 [Micrococcaceae bacterium]|jgi:hypothetical protein|nr:hypothetical protein [Micrococcaceae bacterium]
MARSAFGRKDAATDRTVAGTSPRERTAVQRAALAAGAVLVLLGVLGFVPGVTARYGALTFAGPGSAAMLLGLIQVSVLLNAVHAGLGTVGLLAGGSVASAKSFLAIGGVAQLLLCVFGFVVGEGSVLNFLPVNTPANWLHLVLAVTMMVLGICLTAHPQEAHPQEAHQR